MIIPVSDPFNAAADPALPTLAAALDFEIACNEFKRRLPRLSGEAGRLKLKAIRVVRHKPGKRCVVEYDLSVKRPGQLREKFTLIGKVRARRSGNEGFRQLETIWQAGFDAQSSDGISVPEPVGVIAAFHMWFQRKVPGQVATRLLPQAGGPDLAARIAAAAHKLHRAGIPAGRPHGMEDELRILRGCLAQVALARPDLADRVNQLMTACEKLGASLPEPTACGIHRDFYPDQVIVDGPRLWLIDFDLFCQGDPGLDVGNFLGHVIEQAVRECGVASALQDVERALVDRFADLSGERTRPAVEVYTTLTLARHVYLSSQFPGREQTTSPLLDLCEQRLRAAEAY